MGTKISNDPQRATSVRRTVWVLIAIALVIYVGFILSGVFGVAGTRS
jgi:hypothetical protein